MIRLGDALSLDPTRRARAYYHLRPVDPVPTAAEVGPPIQALIVYNSNPAAVAPDQNAVLAGLRRDDLFTLVLKQFPTDTTDYADYVLPATTQLEHWDIVKPYGHHYLALNRPAIAPLGQALPNSEIFRRLARALGYDEPCFRQSDTDILQEFIAVQTHPTMRGVTWERLLAEGFVRIDLPEPYLPFAEGNFPTPSGKCELYSQRMADDGFDPLPAWTPPNWLQFRASDPQSESPNPKLLLISPPAHNFLNTTFANLERFLRREGEPLLWIHPDDAASRAIAEGDTVLVSNDRGRVQLKALITTDLLPGVVLSPTIWWNKLSSDRRNVNQITTQSETDMGGSPTFYDVLVQVRPWGPDGRLGTVGSLG
jgi:anaerobic selenocysteine-containing dehydrogenase